MIEEKERLFRRSFLFKLKQLIMKKREKLGLLLTKLK